MKNNASYTRFILLFLILLTVLKTVAISQGTDSRRSSVKDKLYFGAFMNALNTNIANEEFSASSTLSYKKGNSINFGFDFGYFFSKVAGINVGVSYGSYSTELSLDSCSIKFQTTDSEDESYEMRILGKSIIENQKISFLSIPVSVIFRIPAGEKLGFFLKGGISFDIPIAKTYQGAGIFTYDGYYPAYPVLLQNLPVYGFPSDLNTSSSGNLQINSFNTVYIVSGGASYSINKSIQLNLGVYISKSLANISAYTKDSNFRLTSKASELNSIMAGSSNAGVQAFGLSLGIKYYLR
ncbi:MAG: outer membrane beta-barrel protein [Bacteroidia bacterium]|nr:outer membrane beta-barrel protein [Bacteroidia bacterium]